MASRTAKRTDIGKENAPPRTKNIISNPVDEINSYDELEGDVAPVKARSKVAKASKADEVVHSSPAAGGKKASSAGVSSSSDLQRKLQAMTIELERVKKQRNEFSKQFEELSKLRNTETESLLDRFKANAELQLSAQTEIMTNLTALNEKQQTRIGVLEKSLAAATKHTYAESGGVPEASGGGGSGKVDKKELKAIKDDLAKALAASKAKDDKIKQLEKEFQAEVAHSQSLQASTRTNLAASTSKTAPSAIAAAATGPAHNAEEVERDQKSLRFYEDLTELQIINVGIKKDTATGKQVTFSCLYTMAERKKTIHFKIRTYNIIDQALVAAKAESPWVEMLEYQPLDLPNDDPNFVDGLKHFASGFVMPRKDLAAFWVSFKDALEASEESDEED